MAMSIVLVGGLPDDPLREDILTRLRARDDSVNWDWIRSDATSNYRPPEKYFRKLVNQFQKSEVTVVQLWLLNGREKASLHNCGDPIQVPKSLSCTDDILNWLFTQDANLIPKNEWYGNRREAALMAILSKLIKNKSWNKDTQGHAWTIEADLLTQTPVNRSDCQIVGVEANRILQKLEGVLLLTKGGTKGTRKEWSICLKHLAVVKRIVLEQTFAHLEGIAEFDSIRNLLAGDDDRTFRIDNEIVTEKVRQHCRMRHEY